MGLELTDAAPANAGYPYRPLVGSGGRQALSRGGVGPAQRRSLTLGAAITAFSTATSRTYPVGNGVYMARVFPYPVNYLDHGHWTPIDDRLVRAGGSAHPVGAGYRLSLPGRLGQAPVSLSADGSSVGLTLLGARAVSGAVSGNKETYSNALPGVTVSYAAQPAVVKEDLVLSHPGTQSQFRYALTLPDSLRPVAQSGEIKMLDASGRVRFVLLAPFMYEAANGPLDVQHRGGVTMSLSRSPGRWLVTVSPDRSWLASAGRRWQGGYRPVTG